MRRGLVFSALAAGGAAAAQARHLRRIASDPTRAEFEAVESGRPLPVVSADGTELHAEVFGPDDAPTIVLVHGWTEGIRYWTLVLGRLKRDLRIVAYDLRGHGHSGRAAGGDYTLPRFGDDLEAVLTACLADGERATVAGHSLGAMSIAAWADRYDVSARASGTAMLFTGLSRLIADSGLYPTPAWAAGIDDVVARKAFLGARGSMPPFSTPVSEAVMRYVAFGPHATPAAIEFYRRLMSECPDDVRAACGLAMADMDLMGAVPRITVPTLVVAGACDRLTPAVHARRIAAALPELTHLIELPETGHMGPLERPVEIADALRELAAGAPLGGQAHTVA